MWNWFSNKRRNIFRYWDGSRTRAIDPAVAWRMMWEHPECDPNRDFGPATTVGPDNTHVEFDGAAQDRVLSMIRDMFHVKAYAEDSPGLTIDETFGLLWSFMKYMEGLKKKRGPLPTMSAPSASSSSDESSITPQESDSASIESESRSAEPLSSSKRSYQL